MRRHADRHKVLLATTQHFGRLTIDDECKPRVNSAQRDVKNDTCRFKVRNVGADVRNQRRVL